MMQNNEKAYEKLIQDRLMKRQMDILDVIGVLCVFIISRKYIKSNAEVGEMVEGLLREKLPGYVVKSRTLMAARTCKSLLSSETLDMMKIQQKLREVLKKSETPLLEEHKKNEKKSRKENENAKLEKWLKGIGNAE